MEGIVRGLDIGLLPAMSIFSCRVTSAPLETLGLRVRYHIWYTMAISSSTNAAVIAPCVLSSLALALLVQRARVLIRGYV